MRPLQRAGPQWRQCGIIVWDTETERQVAALSGAGPESMAISPDGRTLVYTEKSGSALHLWDLAANRDAGLVGATSYGDARSFSPGGKELAVLPAYRYQPRAQVLSTPVLSRLEITSAWLRVELKRNEFRDHIDQNRTPERRTRAHMVPEPSRTPPA